MPTKKLYPTRYYQGLTKKQKKQRKEEINKFGKMHWSNPKAYVGFKTDTLPSVTKKRKIKSQYTLHWDKLFPGKKSLKQRSEVTGVPIKYLDTVFRRGSAAWRTGHRPGQTTQSWSFPRVSSFLLCGKTHYTADADVVSNASLHSKKARKWFRRCPVV
jgi:hypothetical protein